MPTVFTVWLAVKARSAAPSPLKSNTVEPVIWLELSSVSLRQPLCRHTHWCVRWLQVVPDTTLSQSEAIAQEADGGLRDGLTDVCGALSLAVLAGCSSGDGDGERIRAYDVRVQVDRDGSVAVTETIDYSFADEERHGIVRDIPQRLP